MGCKYIIIYYYTRSVVFRVGIQYIRLAAYHNKRPYSSVLCDTRDSNTNHKLTINLDLNTHLVPITQFNGTLNPKIPLTNLKSSHLAHYIKRFKSVNITTVFESLAVSNNVSCMIYVGTHVLLSSVPRCLLLTLSVSKPDSLSKKKK